MLACPADGGAWWDFGRVGRAGRRVIVVEVIARAGVVCDVADDLVVGALGVRA
jgi:hypothetical protein